MNPNVLVIEDEPSHYEAIEKCLEELGFEVEQLGSLNKQQLYNYKALHQESNLIVVDLNLNQSSDFRFDEGLKLVRDELWPVDRTTVFVIFSQHKPDAHLGLPTFVEPHWCYVEKKTDAQGGLLLSCLTELAKVVKDAYRVTPAFLEVPRYEVLAALREYEIFTKRSRARNPETGPRTSIIDSIDLLDRLSRNTHSYSRAGSIAQHVALAVFGSCGRLELRANSDIELCAYYSSDAKGLSKAFAVMLWNRASKLIVAQKRKCEGMSLVERNDDKLLHVNQVDEDLRNTFIPVMPVEQILHANTRREPHIRNRHLQVLTEAKPIFNPHLVDKMKADLLELAGSGKARNIIGSRFWQDLFTQFFTDTRPEKLTDTADYKSMVLRVFNLMILRFEFARQLCLEMWDRTQFLREIADPGIVKLTRFSNWWVDGEGSSKTIARELDAIIQNYISIWDRFDHEGNLSEDLRKLGLSICNCLDDLQTQEQVRHTGESNCAWIWSTIEMRRLLDQL